MNRRPAGRGRWRTFVSAIVLIGMLAGLVPYVGSVLFAGRSSLEGRAPLAGSAAPGGIDAASAAAPAASGMTRYVIDGPSSEAPYQVGETFLEQGNRFNTAIADA
jgi:hypothetical protein